METLIKLGVAAVKSDSRVSQCRSTSGYGAKTELEKGGILSFSLIKRRHFPPLKRRKNELPKSQKLNRVITGIYWICISIFDCIAVGSAVEEETTL